MMTYCWSEGMILGCRCRSHSVSNCISFSSTGNTLSNTISYNQSYSNPSFHPSIKCPTLQRVVDQSPLFYFSAAVPTWGTFFTCHCTAKLSKREPPPGQTANATRWWKEVSVTQARGQLNSICFNSRPLAGMLVLCTYKGFQSCQKCSPVVKTKGWIFTSFRLWWVQSTAESHRKGAEEVSCTIITRNILIEIVIPY